MAFPEAVYTKTYHLRDRYNKSRAPGLVWKCDPAPSRRPIDRTPSKTRCGRSGTGSTWSSLACQQGCTEASHDLSIMTPFSCAAPTPASAAAERDALGLAPVPSTSMLALGDNMVSNVEAAAQSTTEQCSWSAPMAGSSHSCWLSSVLHQHDLSRCGWTLSESGRGPASASWTEAPAVVKAIVAWPRPAAMPLWCSDSHAVACRRRSAALDGENGRIANNV